MAVLEQVETPAAFATRLEVAMGSHDFDQVRPFFAPDAVHISTDGTECRGIGAIEHLFTETWRKIKDEEYIVSNIKWERCGTRWAVYAYTFTWTGMVEGRLRSGRGRGTNTLVCVNGHWLVVRVHLTPR